MAMSVYEERYIMDGNEDYVKMSAKVKVACIIVSVYCILGCVYVKCSINHLICLCLYVIPLFIAVPTITIQAVTYARELDKNNISLRDLLEEVKTHWRKYSKQPLWLQQTELDESCCGIFSWKDYILEIYQDKPLRHGDFINPVPNTCCVPHPGTNGEQFVRNHCGRSNMNFTLRTNGAKHQNEISENFNSGGNGTLTNHTLTTKGENNASTEPTTSNSFRYEISKNESEFYNVPKSSDGFPYLNPEINNTINGRAIIWTKGCGDELIHKFVSARKAYEIFCWFLFIAVSMMIFVYLKSWCSGTNIFGTASSHSLDGNSMIKPKTMEKKPTIGQKHAHLEHSSAVPSHTSGTVPKVAH